VVGLLDPRRGEGGPKAAPAQVSDASQDQANPTPALLAGAYTVTDWLRLVYGQAPGFVSVVALPRGTSLHFATDDLDRAGACGTNLARRTNVFVGCCPLGTIPPHGRGRGVDALALVGVWADLDDATGHHGANALPLPPDREALMVLLDDLGLPPTAIVDSGGGLQCWWLLGRPWIFTDDADRNRAARLSGAFGATLVELGRRRGWHVDDVSDLARILRPPGTVNRKGRPTLVTLVACHPERRYTPEQVADVLVSPTPAPRPPARPRRPLTTSPALAGEGPADVFSRVVSWPEILEPCGWTLVRERDGVGYWRHSTATSEQSATTDYGGTPTLVNFSPNAGLPVGPGHRLTRFRVWSWLHYGGDEAAAARALRDLSRGAA